MKKRKISNWITKILTFILVLSLITEHSIAGYAMNGLVMSQNVEETTTEGEKKSESEISEEESEINSKEFSLLEESSEEIVFSEEESEETSYTEESTSEIESQEIFTTEEVFMEESEEIVTSAEDVMEESGENVIFEEDSMVESEEETESEEEFSKEIAIKTVSQSEDDFVIEDGILTSYTGNAADIVIPEGVTEIADRVFISRTFIKSVVLPSSLKKIGSFAFCGCTSLVKVSLNEGLEYIGDDAFYGSSFGEKNTKNQITYGSVTIPSTVTYIGYEAFCNATYLGEVIFSDEGSKAIEFGLKDNNNSMFRACSNLKKVTLPQRMKEIPASAFQNCPLLEEVVSFEYDAEP